MTKDNQGDASVENALKTYLKPGFQNKQCSETTSLGDELDSADVCQNGQRWQIVWWRVDCVFSRRFVDQKILHLFQYSLLLSLI